MGEKDYCTYIPAPGEKALSPGVADPMLRRIGPDAFEKSVINEGRPRRHAHEETKSWENFW